MSESKTCRRGHCYPSDKRQCPKCKVINQTAYVNRKLEKDPEFINVRRKWISESQKKRYINDPVYRSESKKNSNKYRNERKKVDAAYKEEINRQNREYRQSRVSDPSYKAKQLEYHRNYRRLNSARRKELDRKHRHLRRSRLNNLQSVGVTPEEWDRVLKQYKNTCAYCGTDTDRLTVDHIIPLSLGGLDEPENVVPACSTCNCSKGGRLLHSWYKFDLFRNVISIEQHSYLDSLSKNLIVKYNVNE